ncbi:hypothetical protein H4683_000914 [Filibacter limicola]|uniref:Uncharacterized protein n=1 Tax=Sporosarcina limicola TaxID=34101 RepID=A0A927MG57_9BACL|nr:hypothetical protein [Sporosarcina limicola]
MKFNGNHFFSMGGILNSDKNAKFAVTIFAIYQDAPYIIQYSEANKVIAADFDSRQDIYIFDKNFT